MPALRRGAIGAPPSSLVVVTSWHAAEAICFAAHSVDLVMVAVCPPVEIDSCESCVSSHAPGGGSQCRIGSSTKQMETSGHARIRLTLACCSLTCVDNGLHSCNPIPQRGMILERCCGKELCLADSCLVSKMQMSGPLARVACPGVQCVATSRYLVHLYARGRCRWAWEACRLSCGSHALGASDQGLKR